MISTENRKQLIDQFKKNEQDTGSSEVQIALLTQRINELNEHFDRFSKDYASRTGLMKMVGRRRRLLRYLESHNKKVYLDIVNRLGLRE